MRRIRVYLDTSVGSALFDHRNSERQALTETFMAGLAGFDACISELTLAEIARTPDVTLRDRMMQVVAHLGVLPVPREADHIVAEYVRWGAIPEGYADDALHVAVAVLNDVEFLLSWNYRRLVRRKTRDIVRMVNTIQGLRQVEIVTPAELL